MKLFVIILYRVLLIGALMYTVGYLGWSAWWLLLLSFNITYEESDKK